MYRYILTFLLVALLGSNVKAQDGKLFDQMITFGWDVNIPMGSNSWNKDVSLAGGKFEFRKMVDKNFSLGFDFCWNSYYDLKNTQTYHLSAGTDVTTDLYKYNYTVPMAVTADYYFQTGGGHLIPYVGLGMGAMYMQPKLYFNIYEINQENWGFMMRPEVGTIIKFDPMGDVGLMLAARYTLSTNSEPTFGIEDFKALGFNLGFVWLY